MSVRLSECPYTLIKCLSVQIAHPPPPKDEGKAPVSRVCTNLESGPVSQNLIRFFLKSWILINILIFVAARLFKI